MNPGARRAGAGQGVAAARLLVTLSLLRGVVEAQVSRRWREAGRPEGGGRPDASRKRGAATLGWRRGKRKKVRARRRRFPEDLWSRREGGRENGPAVGRERAQERGGLGLEADPRPGEPGAGADATSLPELSDRRVPGVPARDRCLARRAAPGGVLVQPRAGRKPGRPASSAAGSRGAGDPVSAPERRARFGYRSELDRLLPGAAGRTCREVAELPRGSGCLGRPEPGEG